MHGATCQTECAQRTPWQHTRAIFERKIPGYQRRPSKVCSLAGSTDSRPGKRSSRMGRQKASELNFPSKKNPGLAETKPGNQGGHDSNTQKRFLPELSLVLMEKKLGSQTQSASKRNKIKLRLDSQSESASKSNTNNQQLCLKCVACSRVYAAAGAYTQFILT